jgi:hypothetical protein
VLPTGKTPHSLKKFIDEWRTKPERRTGTATLFTEQSFIDHVNRFQGEDTVLFARRNPTEPTLTAVFDYNPSGGNNEDAAFCQHRAVYPFPVSEQWKQWREHDGKPMGAVEFAQFLEDRIPDVHAVDGDNLTAELRDLAALLGGTFASPSRLLDLSRSLEITASVGVKQAIRLESGESQFIYEETHSQGGQKVTVPSLFVLGIPVFDEGAGYRIACRLRYRRSGTGITWWYTMVDPKRYFDDAIKGSVEHVVEETALPAVYGTPEK